MLLLHFPLKRASLTPGGIFDLCASYLDFDGLGVFFGGDRPVLALVSDIEGKGKTCSLQREGGSRGVGDAQLQRRIFILRMSIIQNPIGADEADMQRNSL